MCERYDWPTTGGRSVGCASAGSSLSLSLSLSLSRARALCVCARVALLLPLILVCVLAAGEAHFPELRHVFIQPGAGDAALTSFCESKGLHVHNGCVLVELTAANSSAW